MDKIWWEETGGPRRFLDSATEFLADGGSVVLCLPKNLPWRDTMRETLHKLLDDKFSTTRMTETVDAKKIPKTPPKYVLENFCANKSGFKLYDKAHAEFLATRRNIALNDRCLWIRNASDAQADEWFSFIADYHGFLANRRGGTFLLEAGANFKGTSTDGVKILAFDKEISDYDCFAFNIMLAAEGGKNKLMKQYLAELVTRLTERNVELAAACMNCRDEFINNPHDVFKRILLEGNFTYAKTYEDIEQAIWVTQLKLIFPLIEDFRREVLLKKYYREISVALPCDSAWQEKIERPEQAELGILIHLVNMGKLWFQPPDWKELLYYRDLRNKLAHLEILPLEEVQRIFDKSEEV